MTETTRDKILSSAENLYAEHGISGTSLRKIVADAGVNIASVHYHFGSKDGLTREVFRRRIKSVNQRRLQLLDELLAEANGAPLKARDLVYAFLAPAVLMGQDQAHGGSTFFRLAARAHVEPDDIVQTVIFEELATTVQLFIRELGRSIPHLQPSEAALRLCFAAGGMLQAVLVPSNRPLINKFFHEPPAAESVINSLVQFVTAGFEAPSTPGKN